MISYYDVLKASKGFYVADTYAMMWGREISGDGKIYEITDVPPLTFISNGSDLIDYRISGNTVQNGTPSPENPAEVAGCGERTENLLPLEDKSFTLKGVTISCKNGRIYLSGTPTAEVINSDRPIFEQYFGFELPAGDYKLTLNNYTNNRYISVSGSTDGQYSPIVPGKTQPGSYYFTLNETTKIFIEIYYTRTSIIPDYGLEVMICRADVMEYQPCGCKIPVTVSGVNLFDASRETLQKVSNTSDTERYGVLTDVLPAGTYMFSYQTNGPYMSYQTVTEGIYSDYKELSPAGSKIYLPYEGRIFIYNGLFKTFAEIGQRNFQLYREPVTTPVYIGSEPLYSGEYVSYREQKIYKMIDGILTPVEPPEPFPAIQTIRGTNILTADTEVQPSEMYIRYQK